MNRRQLVRGLSLIGLAFLFFLPETGAQIVRGRVTDQSTNEPLPAATVQIAGTYKGTITNREGVYEIAVDQLPVKVVVRYIGYRTDTLTAHTVMPLEFQLVPVTIEMEQMVVTDENPAIWIMRQVIERKQVWRKRIQTFEAQAYARYTFSNDSGIVAITESAATAWWDHDRGLREEVTGTRNTGNLPFVRALPAALTMLNLYDDDIQISGHTLIGVTHPDALDKYEFTLEGTRKVDDNVVYDILLKPKYQFTSGFIGSVSVLDGEFALLEARLRPGPAFLFPFPIQTYETTYLQQFSNYGGEVWLPMDLRSNTMVEISMGAALNFPPIMIEMVSRFTDYQLNVPLPDSLFNDDTRMRIDSSAVSSSDVFQRQGAIVPLTPKETLAYARIDSTDSLQEAYKPGGILGRMINRFPDLDDRRSSARQDFSFFSDLGLYPHLWYNRVDAFHGGVQYNQRFGKIFNSEVQIGVNSGQKNGAQWLYKVAIHVGQEWFIHAGYQAENTSTYQSKIRKRLVNSGLMLFGQEDYFDYYRRAGFAVTGGYQINERPATFTTTYLHEHHSPLVGNVSYDLLGKEALQRPNILIPEGDMRTLTFTFRSGNHQPLGIGPSKHFETSFEFSLPNSDYSFRRYYLSTSGRVATFMRRRFMPATLDYGLYLGLASEGGQTLPAQRNFIVEGGTTFYHWGGTLFTLDGLPYQGNGMLFGYWEQNFRTVPFELLGLWSLANQGYHMIVFGGHAFIRGAQPPSNDWIYHNELGLSLGGILGLIRINFAYHIGANRVWPSFGLARIF